MKKIKFDRFEKVFNRVGFKKAELARILSVKPNALQGWFERKSIPGEYLYPIAEALEVSPRYLIGETDDSTRMQIIPIIGKSNSVVPSMSVVVSNYPTIERHYFADGVYAIEADTDAMLPTIQENSLCLCNPNVNVSDNDIVHYSYGDQNGIARYRLSADKQTTVLAPDNSEDHSPIFITWDSKTELRMAKIFRIEQDL